MAKQKSSECSDDWEDLEEALKREANLKNENNRLRQCLTDIYAIAEEGDENVDTLTIVQMISAVIDVGSSHIGCITCRSMVK